ncbi:Alpha/Beta hydrolase protein [Dipodascopsis uninucleata]
MIRLGKKAREQSVEARPKHSSEDKMNIKEALLIARLVPHLIYESAMHITLQRNLLEGWDLRMHLLVSVIRKWLYYDHNTVEEIQARSKKRGLPYKNENIETVPFEISLPESQKVVECLKGTMQLAIDRLTEQSGFTEKPDILEPSFIPVPCEWVIWKREETNENVKIDSNDRVILYFHGGAHYMGSAQAHRFLTGAIADQTESKVLSVDYRLSPQNPLPCALCDGLLAYNYLIDILGVSPSRIFLAGDSSGGSLAISLLNVIRYGGQNNPALAEPLPIPAGILLISPWVELTRCLPSEHSQSIDKYDYIPSANYYPDLKRSESWPAKNMRLLHYVEDNAILHPLASPLTTPSWDGACPMYIAVSEERLADSDFLLVKYYKEARNTVFLYFHEKLPHVFHVLGPTNPSVQKSYQEMKNFIDFCVSKSDSTISGKEVKVNLRGEEEALYREVPDITQSELKKKMTNRLSEFEHLLKFLWVDRKYI